ncbi:MAG TPA: glycosyltransferase [Povalibacter sp.]|nr:glycosyltransferase [Povalibacter sp.]
MRVCVLTNILPPYRVGFYNELARHCDLTVIVDALMTPDRLWSVDHGSIRFNVVVADGWRVSMSRPGNGYASERRYVELANRTLPLLRRLRPDIVISAEMGARTLQALLYAHVRRIPFVCFWEGTPHTEQKVSRRSVLLRRFIARHSSGFWVNGRESAAYAQSLGVAPGRIFSGMTGVDTSHFREESQRRRTERESERSSRGLRGTVFVFSGSLSPRKGIVRLLQATDHLIARTPEADLSLLFVGDGERRQDIERWSAQHPEVPVVITGFVQMQELPRYYTCGDWFVLPTLEDCWPLATLEPLVCGLPQIFSIYNGATADLHAWPGTGLVCDPLDIGSLSTALGRALSPQDVPLEENVIAEVATFYGPIAQAERAAASLRNLLPGRPLVTTAVTGLGQHSH